MSTTLDQGSARRTPRARASADGRRPPVWWVQVAIIVVGYLAYDFVNNLSRLKLAASFAHAYDVLKIERIFGLDVELGANRWLAEHLGLGRILGSYYDTAHLAVTAGVLIAIWVRHRPDFRHLRNALIGTNAIGFVVFWLWPLAPPRMLPGYTDIVMVTNALGAGTSGTNSPAANELAAMPSLHIAYALWCLYALWRLERSPIVRGLAVAHLATTVLVVLSTGNHYTLDLLAGAATFATSALAVRQIDRRRAAKRASEPAAT